MQVSNKIRRATSSFTNFLGVLLIFGFTASCTFIFLKEHIPSTLPWLPYFGLAAFEGGAIRWIRYHKYDAQNAYQFVTGLIMTIVSFVAISACTGIEMISWFPTQVTLPEWIQAALIYAIIGTFLANVLAWIVCELLSPEHIVTWMKHESTDVHIDARTSRIQVIPSTVTQVQTKQVQTPVQKQIQAPVQKQFSFKTEKQPINETVNDVEKEPVTEQNYEIVAPDKQTSEYIVPEYNNGTYEDAFQQQFVSSEDSKDNGVSQLKNVVMKRLKRNKKPVENTQTNE